MSLRKPCSDGVLRRLSRLWNCGAGSRFSRSRRRQVANCESSLVCETLEKRRLLTIDFDDQISEIASIGQLSSQHYIEYDEISSADDVDLLAFDAVAGQEISVAVVSQSSLAPRLRLFGPLGVGSNRQIQELGYAFDGQTLEVPVNVSGRFYVGISEAANLRYNINTGGSDVTSPYANTGSYKLRLADTGDSGTSTRPELKGDKFDVLPATVSRGRTFDVEFSIRNDGNTLAAASEVAFYASENAYISSSDTLLGKLQVPSISPNSTYSDTVRLTVPIDYDVNELDQLFSLGMIVDSADDINESQETNNSNLGASIDLETLTLKGINRGKPGTPEITGPGNTTDTTPTFRWTSAENATRYELWVNNNGMNQRVIHDTNLTGTSFTPSSALNFGKHFVWVRAWNGGVAGEWSAGQAFQLDGVVLPTRPNVAVPATTTDTSPELSWASSGATHYEVWINNATTGERTLYRERVTGTSMVPDTGFVAGRYVVWVRAWNGSQKSEWSAPQRLEILGGEPLQTPTANELGNTADLTPTFTWTASGNATHYELWVQNRKTGERLIYHNDLQGTSFTATSELTSGNYAMWVRAWNGSQKSGWSSRRDFTLTVSTNPDPNGSNNVRENSIYLANGSTADRLTAADQTDYYHVNASNRNPRIRFTWTIEVTSGDSGDMSALLEDQDGDEYSSNLYTVTRTGNTITLSTGSSYLYTRYHGDNVFLKLQLRPGAATVDYRVASSNVHVK